MNKAEVSHKSIGLIEARFRAHRSRLVWVPDWNIPAPTHADDNLDIILMGSYFEKIFQPHIFPQTPFSLFCLSHSVRNALISLFELPGNSIGLIDRSHLFKPSSIKKSFELNSLSTLVFGGRLSPQKNIEFLIFTLFHLQILFSKDVKLLLLGDFDDVYHKDILGLKFTSYEQKILNLIEQLPWPGEKPSIVSQLNQQEWLNHLPANGIFVTSSDLISEDFSVSAAQCEEIGYPMLLPSWAGLNDVRASNVYHFDVNLLANSHTEVKWISQKARAFSQMLIEKKYFQLAPKTFSQDIIPTEKMSRAKLEDIYQINLKKWGDELSFLSQGDIAGFAISQKGQDFFKALRRNLTK